MNYTHPKEQIKKAGFKPADLGELAQKLIERFEQLEARFLKGKTPPDPDSEVGKMLYAQLQTIEKGIEKLIKAAKKKETEKEAETDRQQPAIEDVPAEKPQQKANPKPKPKAEKSAKPKAVKKPVKQQPTIEDVPEAKAEKKELKAVLAADEEELAACREKVKAWRAAQRQKQPAKKPKAAPKPESIKDSLHQKLHQIAGMIPAKRKGDPEVELLTHNILFSATFPMLLEAWGMQKLVLPHEELEESVRDWLSTQQSETKNRIFGKGKKAWLLHLQSSDFPEHSLEPIVMLADTEKEAIQDFYDTSLPVQDFTVLPGDPGYTEALPHYYKGAFHTHVEPFTKPRS